MFPNYHLLKNDFTKVFNNILSIYNFLIRILEKKPTKIKLTAKKPKFKFMFSMFIIVF